ncbi:MAG: S24/S26 family peptidase [Armatimonadota bacterium]
MIPITKPADELLPVISDILKQRQNVRFTTTGNSMWPFLRHNDTIESAAVTGTLHPGAILLAKLDDDSYVIHRLYRIDGDFLYLLGDSLSVPEGPLAHDAVIGEVLSVQRGRHWRVMNRGWWRFLGVCWMSLFPCRKGLLRLLRVCAKFIKKTQHFISGSR